MKSLIDIARAEIGQTEKPLTWYPLKGYEGLYEITQCGMVRVIGNQKALNSVLGKNGSNVLSQQLTKFGYKKVLLSKDGLRKTYTVHRLVALTFIDNPFNKKTVNHIDGNKTNNNLSNLEWATQSENVLHSFNQLGKKSVWLGKKGALSHSAKSVICLQNGFVFDTVKDAAEFVRTIPSEMSKHLSGKSRKIKGHSFQFV